MKISIFGIGYVGAVTAACLAESGHDVIAVDPSPAKRQAISNGQSPIVETGLDDMIQNAVRGNRLRATGDYTDAVMASDISLICVGTPSNADGGLNLDYIRQACEQIGSVIAMKPSRHTVIIRSTVLPGTMMNVVVPALESASGMVAGRDFGLGNNPEFLREGTAIADYKHPTQIVAGALDDATARMVMDLYAGLDAPRIICAVDVAEGVKYVSNAWRAHKIAFANEMGNILKDHGVDSHKVMDIFFQDTRINLGKSFLMPGFAFGGSCLPKDLRAIRASANDRGLKTPVFDSLLAANTLQIERAHTMIRTHDVRRVAMLGLAFKPGTDDLRESPLVALARLLLADGVDLRIYDPCVKQAMGMDGAGRHYMLNDLPDLARCMVDDLGDLKHHAELFVLGHGTPEFVEFIGGVDPSLPIVDLARARTDIEKRPAYSGICW